MLTLDPLEASHDERDLKVTGHGEAITRSGVLVGEVWFSSGQSNMDWIPGTQIAVAFGDQEKKTTVDEFERWHVTLDPMPASGKGRDLDMRCSNGETRTVRDVLVGDVCKQAIVAYIETVKQYNRKVAALLEAGEEIPTELADRAPAFPEPYYNQWASRTETATHTCNFCISPLTPLAVRGVTWIPDKDNISEDISKYSPSLEVYAASLAETYGQEKVPFLYAQPAACLVEGIATPQIEGALSIGFDQWPKSLEAIATQLGTLAAEELK